MKLAVAIAIAAQAHVDQVDKSGQPYILHPLKVMHYVQSKDPEVLQIAVLHDVIEDTYVTEALLRELGFSDRVIAGVVSLTRLKGETNEEYLARILANPDAVLVKLADLRHNMDSRRLKKGPDGKLRQKDIDRLAKYANMVVVLETALEKING